MILLYQYFVIFAYSQISNCIMSVTKLKNEKAVTHTLSAKKGAVRGVMSASDETSASFAPTTAAAPLPNEKISGDCNSLLDMYKTASPGQRVILKAVSEEEKIFYAAVKAKSEFFRECQKLMQPHGVRKQCGLPSFLKTSQNIIRVLLKCGAGKEPFQSKRMSWYLCLRN